MAALLLKRFLARAARRGFVRGDNDCMLFAADWVRLLSGRDPAAPYRQCYATEQEADRILATAGGAVAIVERAIQPLGWLRVEGERTTGDIALVEPPGHHEITAGVCVDNKRIALVTKRGLVVWPLPAIAVWRLSPHG